MMRNEAPLVEYRHETTRPLEQDHEVEGGAEDHPHDTQRHSSVSLGHFIKSFFTRSRATAPRRSSVSTSIMSHDPTRRGNLQHERPFNILCLDGGGVKSLAQCEILQALQSYLPRRPISEMFDMIVGTGAGALLACIIAQNKHVEDARHVLNSVARDVFGKTTMKGTLAMIKDETRGKLNSKLYYSYLERAIGQELLLDPREPDPKLKLVLLTAELNKRTDSYETVLFRNYRSPYRDRGQDFEYIRVNDAIKCSTAAPFMMDAIQLGDSLFVGGEVLNNNPTLQAIMEARAVFGPHKRFTVLNVGTGDRQLSRAEQTLKTLQSEKESLIPKQRKGITMNASRLIKVSYDSLRIADDVEKYLVSSCEPGQISYFRFSPSGISGTSVATHKPEKLNRMLSITHEYIQHNKYELRRCAQCLTEQRLR